MFSGAERQRIVIARSLICKTQFLILDEGISNLDNITAKQILDSGLELPDTANIVITHQLNYNVLKRHDCI